MGYHGNRHRMAGGGSIFGGIGKILGGAAKGLFTGGPIGAIKGAIGGTVAAVRSGTQAATLGAGTDTRGDAARLARIHAQHAATLAAKAPLGNPAAVAMIGPGAMMNVGAGGGGGGGGGGGRRRMNWANSRALGRAERRIKSAVHHMTKYIRWVHPTRQGHAAPKFKKKGR